MPDNKPPVVSSPVVAAPAATTPKLKVMCAYVRQAPAPVLVDEHNCMREEFSAGFVIPMEPKMKNSRPLVDLHIKSIFPLPYEKGEYYELQLVPVKK